MSSLTQLPQWQSLQKHAEKNRSVHVRELFATDPARFDKFSRTDLNLLFDFSRQRVNEETLSLLLALADARGLRSRIDAMFAGEKINVTENRAVLHTALRNRSER
ncbi:MAG: glucose-6-phosphate isomerase, partial [Povalibacter sp.]